MYDDSAFYFIIALTIAALLAIIPANIAKNKGYSAGLWWFYGWMLFIVAIIHVSLIPDKNAPQSAAPSSTVSYAPPSQAALVDELKTYKDLYDQNIITEAEFQKKKEQILDMMQGGSKR